MPRFKLEFVQPNFETCGYDGRELHVIDADDMDDAWAKGKLMEPEVVERNKWDPETAGLAIVRSLNGSQWRRFKRAGVTSAS